MLPATRIGLRVVLAIAMCLAAINLNCGKPPSPKATNNGPGTTNVKPPDGQQTTDISSAQWPTVPDESSADAACRTKARQLISAIGGKVPQDLTDADIQTIAKNPKLWVHTRDEIEQLRLSQESSGGVYLPHLTQLAQMIQAAVAAARDSVLSIPVGDYVPTDKGFKNDKDQVEYPNPKKHPMFAKAMSILWQAYTMASDGDDVGDKLVEAMNVFNFGKDFSQDWVSKNEVSHFQSTVFPARRTRLVYAAAYAQIGSEVERAIKANNERQLKSAVDSKKWDESRSRFSYMEARRKLEQVQLSSNFYPMLLESLNRIYDNALKRMQTSGGTTNSNR